MSGRKSKPSTSTARLKQDYLRLRRDPVPYISAEPLPHNILEWHYVVRGPEDSPYYGGFYHGHLVFPREFPFKPPSIYMRTPNGRFKTNTRLCLSISDFHPDTWNPAWSVSTILTGLLSFMLETTPTYGSTEASTEERREFARASISYNLQNATFCELFPDIVDEMWRLLGYSDTPPPGTAPVPYFPSVNDATRMTNNNGRRSANRVNTQTASSSKQRQEDDAVATAAENANFYAADAGVNNADQREAMRLLGPRHLADPDSWQSLCSNVAVLAGFAIFAYVANYLIKNLNQE